MDDFYAMQRCPPNTTAYVIKSGDTLYSLARRFGTTVDSILAINPLITDPTYLRVGQRICIPRQPNYPACPGGRYYVIRRGDTFYAIARSHSTTVEALTAANPTVNPNALAIGQVICIPAPAPGTCPAGMTAYAIKAGDTLYALARARGITLESLLQANPGVNPNALMIGQTICIPG